MIYAIWHFAKAAFFRPESPFDWSPAERDLLSAMPLVPRELVAYQIASVTVTTILKAGLFTVLLLPDLRSLTMGFAGLLLAMLALELLRMAVDIAAWGMGRGAYMVYRTAVVAGLVVGGLAVGKKLVGEYAFARIELGDGLLDRLLAILVQVNGSIAGTIGLPFRPFVDLIVAESANAADLRLAGVALVIVAGLAFAVIGLYARTVRRVARRERDSYLPVELQLARNHSHVTGRPRQTALQRLPYLSGAGALAWRQLVGARRHWGSLLTAMIAPAILTCAPLFVIADPFHAFLGTTITLAFYTFLLLPTALRFDFRRDFERLSILKGLPITPCAAVLGQMLTPILIATAFQAAVLAVAIAARSLPLGHLGTALVVLVPLNALVFALDNFIFLLYPYRAQQEGLEVFFRTMLTFTGKGLLFAAGLGVVAGWGFAAAAIARAVATWTGGAVNAYAVFATGLFVGPAVLALLVLFGLCRAYQALDPVEDGPR